MLDLFIYINKNYDVKEVCEYFAVHFIFIILFLIQFFFILSFKRCHDRKNIYLKNVKNSETNRLVVTTFKTIFSHDQTIYNRYSCYSSYYYKNIKIKR